MYNSKPRYSRYDGGITLPQNYAGNAFRNENEPTVEDVTENIPKEKPLQESYDEVKVLSEEPKAQAENFSDTQKKRGLFQNNSGFGFDVGKIFRGGLGFEELLILGVILLMSQGENNDDIMILLLLLLFIQ